MAKERLSMRKIKEVLRLHFEHHQSARQIAKSCSIARSTAQEYLHRAQQAAIPWPLPEGMDDATLENRLFPRPVPVPQEKRHMPPLEDLHRERKKKGVTLQLLWHEYKESNPDGSTASSARSTASGWNSSTSVSARNTGPERNSFSIMPAKRCQSGTL